MRMMFNIQLGRWESAEWQGLLTVFGVLHTGGLRFRGRSLLEDDQEAFSYGSGGHVAVVEYKAVGV